MRKRFFITDADGLVLRQGVAEESTLEDQMLDDGVKLFCSEESAHGLIDDSLYQIGEGGGFEPRPDATEPGGGFAPPGGMLDARIS